MDNIEKYKFVIEDKKNIEQNRDTNNNFYIFLFSPIIAGAPFIPDVITETHPSVKNTMVFLSFMCLSLATNWLFSLYKLSKKIDNINIIIVDLKKKIGFEYHSKLSISKRGNLLSKMQLLIPTFFVVMFLSFLIF